ncbi:hypothetical protein V6N12_047863 [Hibiscus sabdariffa]|uniref:Uncharacterized protein n=1 Tax=Hibiscus sabdariffa TaxID=183260 RepID=A0ABR2CU75_9ROSI
MVKFCKRVCNKSRWIIDERSGFLGDETICGVTEARDEFEELLDTIEEIGGKFLLALITNREDFFHFVEVSENLCIWKITELLSGEIWTEFICR